MSIYSRKIYFFLIGILLIISCDKIVSSTVANEPNDTITTNLTIFMMNDMHAQINNFAKVKFIIEKEREHTNVLVTSAGDIFSGNPVVDFHEQKGSPMIDLMNNIGVDISAVGNHEFDYGQSTLTNRMNQANFSWVCANVDMENTGVPQPSAYKTLEVGDLKVTFLGLIETNGSSVTNIPLTHPLRVEGITFERPENVVVNYSDIKAQEKSDLYIALTHLGHDGGDSYMGDFQLAQNYPYFDLIIGGHSHAKIDTTVSNIPIFQAGGYLNYLGEIKLTVKDKKVESYTYQRIDLNSYSFTDESTQTIIDHYNSDMTEVLDEPIGNATIYHSSDQVGCFYTDALCKRMHADISFQNSGGIRSSLDAGEITKREIYAIDPFNNKAMLFNMTIADIKRFLIESGSGFFYAGVHIEQNGNEINISDLNGNLLENNTILKLAINDYIPAVYPKLFNQGEQQGYTTAEAIIYYLKNISSEVNYPECNRYFRYEN